MKGKDIFGYLLRRELFGPLFLSIVFLGLTVLGILRLIRDMSQSGGTADAVNGDTVYLLFIGAGLLAGIIRIIYLLPQKRNNTGMP